MKALGKTLFGDRRHIVVVAGVVVLESLAVAAGYPRAGALLMPPVLLIVTAWLATR
jgi:hypothetical protein